jgi:thiol-disulfide isomerase/thioredoxin
MQPRNATRNSAQTAVRNTLAQLGFIALAATSVFGFVQAAKGDHQRSACTATCALVPAWAGRNRLAPDFTLNDLDGKEFALSSLRGKTVVLNFWASWCDPCREEMPSLAKLALLLRKHPDVVLVTVSVDEQPQTIRDTLEVLFRSDEELRDRLAKGEIPFAVLHDPEMAVVKGRFGTTMYPETWVIDPEGYIRARYDGARDWAGALALEAIRSTTRGAGCLADFERSKPTGAFARLCEPE